MALLTHGISSGELVRLLPLCKKGFVGFGKSFAVFCVFSFPPAVYVGTINLIASIPGPSILTFDSNLL